MRKTGILEYRSGRENGLWGVLEGSFFGIAVDFGAAALQEGREGGFGGLRAYT
jgi:hypothetical protein